VSNRPSHDWQTFREVLGEAPPPAEVDRRIVEGVLERPPRRRVGLWAGLAVAGAAACLLVALWLGGILGQGGAGEALPAAGTEWAAPRSSPSSRSIGPHRIALAPGARLRVVGGTTRTPELAVNRGKVVFTVAPLRGGRFAVRTRHARVTVLGTRFSVALEPRCTRVEVTRGKVRVEPRRGGEARMLTAGQSRSVCELPPNRLDRDGRSVLRAITLTRKGERLEQAEQLLAEYLERQPEGGYAEEALYFLVLVKERLGKHDEAAKLARSFLRRFPSTSRARRLRRWLEKNDR
jgi:ferric-dicitrate binding protein FerR (iron transport regulator)